MQGQSATNGFVALAAKLKAVAICSLVLGIISQAINFFLSTHLLQQFYQEIVETETYRAQLGIEDVASVMMQKAINDKNEELFFGIVVSLLLAAAGFFGASKMIKPFLRVFCCCGFFSGCLNICELLFLALLLASTPYVDGIATDLEMCNVYKECIKYSPNSTYSTDCIAAVVWPAYNRTYAGHGSPESLPVHPCSKIAFSTLNCNTNDSTSVLHAGGMQNDLLRHAQRSLVFDHANIMVATRLLRIFPSGEHSSALRRLRSSKSGKGGSTPQIPSTPPRDLLTACQVNTDKTRGLNDLPGLIRTCLPELKVICIVSMVFSVVSVVMNCKGAWYANQLLAQFSTRPSIMLHPGLLTQPTNPQITNESSGISLEPTGPHVVAGNLGVALQPTMPQVAHEHSTVSPRLPDLQREPSGISLQPTAQQMGDSQSAFSSRGQSGSVIRF